MRYPSGSSVTDIRAEPRGTCRSLIKSSATLFPIASLLLVRETRLELTDNRRRLDVLSLLMFCPRVPRIQALRILGKSMAARTAPSFPHRKHSKARRNRHDHGNQLAVKRLNGLTADASGS
jgi:hypothetical protein